MRDGYNVIEILRDLGASFEEIACLGCRINGEPELKLTPELIAVGFTEKEERARAEKPPR